MKKDNSRKPFFDSKKSESSDSKKFQKGKPAPKSKLVQKTSIKRVLGQKKIGKNLTLQLNGIKKTSPGRDQILEKMRVNSPIPVKEWRKNAFLELSLNQVPNQATSKESLSKNHSRKISKQRLKEINQELI